MSLALLYYSLAQNNSSVFYPAIHPTNRSSTPVTTPSSHASLPFTPLLADDYDFGSDCALHGENLSNREVFRKGVSLFQRVIA